MQGPGPGPGTASAWGPRCSRPAENTEISISHLQNCIDVAALAQCRHTASACERAGTHTLFSVSFPKP